MLVCAKIVSTLLQYNIPKENLGLESVLSFHLSHTHCPTAIPFI